MTRTLLSGLMAVSLGVALGLPGHAPAQDITEQLIHLYSDEMAIYLDDSTEQEIISYQEPRDVRICADQRKHTVAIKVKYDGNENVVKPGSCFEFEAKRVVVTPNEPLEPGWDLAGRVKTRGSM